MRVLVVTPWYPQAGDGGGSFVEDQVSSVAMHHEPAVLHLTPTGSGPSRLETGGRWLVLRAAPPIPALRGTAAIRDLAGVATGIRRLRAIGFRPELLHAHVFGAALASVPAARMLRIPLVVSEHYSGLARGDVGRRGRLAASIAYRSADAVCPVSASLRDTVAGLAPRARLLVMPNPVDERRFSPPEAGRKEGPVRVLVVAALVPVKGVDVLIEAVSGLAARRRDLRVTIIGDGPERSAYVRRVQEAGMGELIQLAGRRSRAEVAEAMQDADLLVAPSRWETFSVSVAEALCSGLPVLGTRAGALPELVDESNGRLVEPGDPVALAAALDDMLDTLTRYDRADIAQRAAGRWGAESVGRRWSELYAELAERDHPAPRHG